VRPSHTRGQSGAQAVRPDRYVISFQKRDGRSPGRERRGLQGRHRSVLDRITCGVNDAFRVCQATGVPAQEGGIGKFQRPHPGQETFAMGSEARISPPARWVLRRQALNQLRAILTSMPRHGEVPEIPTLATLPSSGVGQGSEELVGGVVNDTGPSMSSTHT